MTNPLSIFTFQMYSYSKSIYKFLTILKWHTQDFDERVKSYLNNEKEENYLMILLFVIQS